MVITRRQFSRAALTGLALPALTGRWASASPVSGVRLGVQTYSFREIAKPGGTDSVDIIIGAMKSCGLDECELWSPQIELAGASRANRPCRRATEGAKRHAPMATVDR